jgi:hypothetical protein
MSEISSGVIFLYISIFLLLIFFGNMIFDLTIRRGLNDKNKYEFRK